MFLEIQNASKIYGVGDETTVALRDFSFSVADDTPSITAVAGESGSGKSTLANLLLGFISPTSGRVLYRGTDLKSLSGAQKKNFRREVQAIFQDPFGVYNPFYRVDHLLSVPIKGFGLAKGKDETRAMMEGALSTVGLKPDEILGRYPHQLSGGQRQRITIARALLLKPRLIIADEPVSMVDASLRATILESLMTLYRDFGISFVYITHDLATAYQISQNLIVLYQGTVSEAGPVRRVIDEPHHPYTRLLVQSIPLPDPDRRWDAHGSLPVRDVAEVGTVKQGCPFAPRCPSVMPVCREDYPPLYLTDDRAARCYLYRDAETVPDGDMTRVFVRDDAPVVAK